MKEFVGRVVTRKTPFMDGEVEIKVLTVGDAKEIDKMTKKLNSKKNGSEADQLELLRFVIRKSVIGAEELTDEEMDSFPITELTKLSEAIMGIGDTEGNG